jgi:hypothetical protein
VGLIISVAYIMNIEPKKLVELSMGTGDKLLDDYKKDLLKAQIDFMSDFKNKDEKQN